MERRIHKQIELKEPMSRVWQDLTDHHSFGEWFGVKLTAPFEVGKIAYGPLTFEGMEHVTLEARVQRLEPEHHFSYTWHPYAIDKGRDYSSEHPTLVEFKLEKTHDGTRLHITETGFGKMPVSRREEAFHMNEKGWTQQLVNIEKYLKEHP